MLPMSLFGRKVEVSFWYCRGETGGLVGVELWPGGWVAFWWGVEFRYYYIVELVPEGYLGFHQTEDTIFRVSML